MARLHKYDDFGHIRMANLCLFAILPLLENTLYGENVSHKGITRTDRRTDRQTDISIPLAPIGAKNEHIRIRMTKLQNNQNHKDKSSCLITCIFE